MKLIINIFIALTICSSAYGYDLNFVQKNRTDLIINEALDGSTMDQDYLTIGSVEVTEITNDTRRADELKNYQKDLGSIIITAGKLLALGKKIWAIVEGGRPVSTTSFSPAVSVLPNVESPQTAFYEMENWSMPKVRTFRVVYKNLFGMEVVSFTYGVYYQNGGQYKGKGRYLTGVNVDARDVQVSWGFEFNASSSVVAITNRGSSANPNAGLTIKINYVAKSIFKEIKSSESFHLTGNGQFVRIQ